jgi:uncharacterized protein (TIGR03067 family)
MRALFLALLFVAGSVQADHAKRPNVAKELIGKWQLTKGVVAGSPLPEPMVKNIKLELTDGKYRLGGAESPDQGTWKLLSGMKPLGLDITGTDGPNKGKKIPAIVRLSGDKLTVCYDLSGKSRPTKFESKKQTMQFLADYKRVKS